MKYSKTLDLIIASLDFASQGKIERAAAFLDKALRMKDVASVVEALDKMNGEARAAEQATAALEGRSSALAKALAAKAAAKKVKAKPAAKKPAGKGKPFGGKMAPPFKKKAKADLDPTEDFTETLDDMVVDADLSDGVDDLNLDDIAEDIEEMPEATADGAGDDVLVEDIDLDGEGTEDVLESTAADDEEKEDKDDGEDDAEDKEDEDEDEAEEEEAKPAEARASLRRTIGNISALSRLQKKPATAAPAKK